MCCWLKLVEQINSLLRSNRWVMWQCANHFQAGKVFNRTAAWTAAVVRKCSLMALWAALRVSTQVRCESWYWAGKIPSAGFSPRTLTLVYFQTFFISANLLGISRFRIYKSLQKNSVLDDNRIGRPTRASGDRCHPIGWSSMKVNWSRCN